MLIASGAEFEVTGIPHSASRLRMRVEMVQSAVQLVWSLEVAPRELPVRVNGLLGDSPMPVFPDKRQRLVGLTGARQRTRSSPKSGVGLSVKAFHNPGR